MARWSRSSSTALRASRSSMPRHSRSCRWRAHLRLSRPISAATPICWSSRGPGSSARATRSGPKLEIESAEVMLDRYGVVGNPVAHSKSPEIHAAFARASGQAMEYVRLEAPLDRFAAAVDAFRAQGGKGLNVTLPFKESAYRYCQRVSDRSRTAQVVNTLVFSGRECYGDTTDGTGLVTDIRRNIEFDLQRRHVLLMGAGGAAQGVIGALLEIG